jgi:hypothetical protein
MHGLVPGTHVFRATKQGVGGRDKPGHDELGDSAWWKHALAALSAKFKCHRRARPGDLD